MPFSPCIQIGTAQNKVSEATTIVTTTLDAPAGALIVFGFADTNAGNVTSVADSSGNSYQLIKRQVTVGLAVNLWYISNCLALPASSTITLTWTAPLPLAKAVSVFCITGEILSSPFDISNDAGGVSATPSITNFATATDYELTVGLVATIGPGTDGFTQDSAFVNAPLRIGTTGGTDVTLAGGSIINRRLGIFQTYAPTLGIARTWEMVIASFMGVVPRPEELVMPQGNLGRVTLGSRVVIGGY